VAIGCKNMEEMKKFEVEAKTTLQGEEICIK
jgi:hypothetical protein